MAIDSSIVITEKEPIIFTPATGSAIQLLVNPEQLNLRWRKVLNRVRTKTRLVTKFWGEEPVNFNYRGQTGYTFPTNQRRKEVSDQIITDSENTKEALLAEFEENKAQLEKTNSPTRQAELERRQKEIQETLNFLQSIRSQDSLTKLHAGVKTNTGLHLLSSKYLVLKKLEALYRKHQDPNTLISVTYRQYEFKGYFESFSFTDDARNPWNWIYNIEFIILEWYDSIQITDTGEVQLAPEEPTT